jgi:hypothetical protein
MDDRRSLGIAALLVAIGPVAFILIFGSWGGAGLSQTDAADPTIAIPFLRAHPGMIVAPTLNSLVMHVAAIALAIGLLPTLRDRGATIATIGAALGVMWGVLDIAQSLVTYNAILARPTADPATIDIVTKGLQNAAHLGGGLWTLSIVATSATVFGGAHRGVGLLAGVVFALHPLVVPAVPAYFYLEFALLPLWFGWTGLAILRSPSARFVPAMA